MGSPDTGQDIALVIPSCDQYSDVWPPLLEGLKRFWPENAYRKYLITNHLSPKLQGVELVRIGEDISWSDNLRNALERITEEYVLLNIDDLIICDHVDHKRVSAVISRFVAGRGNYLRLNPTPKGVDVGRDLDIVPVGDIYRASTQFSIWRKEVLNAILRSGESAWDFEIYGTARSDCFDEWFAAREDLLKYVNLVIKGKVDPRALATLDRCGIVYLRQRPVLSGLEMLSLMTREMRSAVFSLLPRSLKRAIREAWRFE